MKTCWWTSVAGSLMALALLTGPSGPVRAQADNLALQATASASSVWQGGTDFAANKANDGDPTTRWNSESGDAAGSWLQLDWKAPVTLNKVAIDEDFNRVRAFQLQIPDPANPSSLKTIYDSTGTNINPTGSSTPTYTVNFKDPVSTMSLRFTITDATTVPSIFEFRVYNVPLGTVTGKVTDSSGNAIQGASVSANGSIGTTDAQGTYTITAEAGTTDVTASKSGEFRSRTARQVNIPANGTLTQNFMLLGLPMNLAKSATADASTFYQSDPTYDATKINDGDLTTRWNSDAGDVQGSYVDLTWTAPQTFNSITIHEAIGRITDYSIQQLDSTNNYVTVVEKMPGAGTGDRVLSTVLPMPITTKGLRILINDATDLPSIYEVEVAQATLSTISGTVKDIGTGKPVAGAAVLLNGGPAATSDMQGAYSIQVAPDDYLISASAMGYFAGTNQVASVNEGMNLSLDLGLPAQGTNLALGATASASNENGGPASNVNDGDPTTTWSTDTDNNTNQWVAVTFKAATTFNVVVLMNLLGTIQKSDIQYLDTDGKTWIDVPNSTFNPETLAVQGKQPIIVFDKPVTSTAVRYFINYTNSTTGVPGVGEMEVYNSPIGQMLPGTGMGMMGNGDLNGDGKVDIKDATLSLQIAVGSVTATAAQTAAGDVNGDGKLNIQDTTLILEKAVGL